VVAVAGSVDGHRAPLIAVSNGPYLQSPSDSKTPLFFPFEIRHCAKGCIGDDTWYAIMTVEVHQSTCCVSVGVTHFFEDQLNLPCLVLANGAKSNQIATANLLDRIKVSPLHWSVGRSLLINFAVFKCSTVTDPHLATATRA
jgi:hypothetical protein